MADMTDTLKAIHEGLSQVFAHLPAGQDHHLVLLVQELHTALGREARQRDRFDGLTMATLGGWLQTEVPDEDEDTFSFPAADDMPTQGAWAGARPWAAPAH